MDTKKFMLGAHKAAVICTVLERIKVYLVSSMSDEIVKNIFMHPVRSPQEGLDMALKEYGENSSVLVIPYANSVLPCVEN